MRILSIGIIAGLLFTACSSEDEVVLQKNSGRAQGTFYNISYKAPSGVDYHRQIDSILFAVDLSLSAWNSNSTLTAVNRQETDSTADPLFNDVIHRGLQISQSTHGAFDMTIAPLVNVWGFGAEDRVVPDSATVDSLMRLCGYRKVKHEMSGKIFRPQGLKFDVNAIAQGYSVDLIAQYLESKGIRDYLVEVGGEMRALGTNMKGSAWVVGIDKPSETIQEERFQVIIYLDSLSLATSGNYRKFFVDEETGAKYSHTIDPSTGYPVRDRLLSASIIAPDCMTADAIATACMVMGLDKAKAYIEADPKLEAYFVYFDLKGEWETWNSKGFEALIK